MAAVSAADLAGLVEVGRPAISVDGGWAATIHSGPQIVELVVTRLDGVATEHRLTLRAPETEPCWRWDGATVLVADDGVLHGLSVFDGSVTTMPLPAEAGRVRKVAVRPDGLLILAAREDQGRVWTSSVRGGVFERLDTTGDILDIAPAPDASTGIAIVAGPDQDAHLVALDFATGHTVRTLSNRVNRPTTRDRTLEVSPDGTRALFSFGGISNGHRPAVVPISGGSVRMVLPDEVGTVLAASWTDDRTVVAQVFQETRSVLIRVCTGTGKVTELGRFNTGQPRFSHSRRTGRIVSVDGQADSAPNLHVWGGTRRRRVSDANPWLQTRTTAPVSEVT